MSSEIKKFDYQKDKRVWLHYENGTKVKLRKYISEITKGVTKVNGKSFNINRDYIIKAYNTGGLKVVKLWIESEFNNIKQENEKNNENKIS